MEHSRFMLAIGVLTMATAGSGCSQGPVNIGDQTPTTQLKTGLAAYAASWDGYIEAYSFADGSDRVRVTVNEDGTGSIRFGNEDLLPQPTDPNAKFPPDLPMCEDCYLYSANAIPDVYGGFLFSLNDVHVATERLQGTSTNKEVFEAWCKLQTSHQLVYSDSSGNIQYNCSACNGNSPASDMNPSDFCMEFSSCPYYTDAVQSDAGITSVPSLCERELLCNGSNGTVIAAVDQTCFCDANGCDIDRQTQNITLDAVLDDSQQTLTGTLALPKAAGTTITNYTVVLKRQ